MPPVVVPRFVLNRDLGDFSQVECDPLHRLLHLLLLLLLRALIFRGVFYSGEPEHLRLFLLLRFVLFDRLYVYIDPA